MSKRYPTSYSYLNDCSDKEDNSLSFLIHVYTTALSVALSCLFGIWIIPFLYLDHAFLGFGSCLFWDLAHAFLVFGLCLFWDLAHAFLGFASCLFWDLVHEITEIEIVQEPVRKLKAETIDKALQQIREACDVLESDLNIVRFLAFKQHILAGTSIYKKMFDRKS